MHTRSDSSSIRLTSTLCWLPFLLSACGQAPQSPLATTVCDLAAHAQRSVQIDAVVVVDADGRTLISDAHCAASKVELQLSAAAARAGADQRLRAAAQRAVSSGGTNIPVRLTGVYTQTASGAVFIADSVN